MSLRFHYCEAHELAPFEPGLHALERSITYPLDGANERFFIDHGERYPRFFEALGHARFLVAEADGEPKGLIAGVWKDVRLEGAVHGAIYLGDLKLSRELRGGRVAAQLFAHGLAGVLKRGQLSGVRLFFGAGMSDGRDDVRRSFKRGLHLGRLGRAFARLRLFFARPATLASLEGDAPPPPEGGAELSSRGAPLVLSTSGRKDLRLVSTGAPWPLVHLPRGPAEWRGGLAEHLRAAGRELLAAPHGTLACFALDERLTVQLDWLAERGLAPGATATVIGLAEPFAHRKLVRSPWVHLATSEI